jgi:hypothetical protein
LFDLQQLLAAKFSALQAERSGHVFFIEHGLDVVELDELRGSVRDGLAAKPLEHVSWGLAPLPLLVTATEVGYGYRGNGTDFWPRLEAEMGTSFSQSARSRIKHLFQNASDRYRGVYPADSPWARAFHLIAWPISHALLPVEFHRPLASVLPRLGERVRDLDDERLYAALRHITRQPSARFETWLANAELVVTMVRHLLGEQVTGVSPLILDRIGADLLADNVVRRDLATAKRVQRDQRPKRQEHEVLHSVEGRLQLQFLDGRLLLTAQFPRLDPQVEPSLRRELRMRRYAPQLWGVSSRVPSEQLLSGVPFVVSLPQTPQADVPLLPDVDALPVAEEHKNLLRSLKIDLSPPLLFVCSSDRAFARQVRGVPLLATRRYWLLAENGSTAHLCAFPEVGAVGPYKVIELDPAVDAAATVLREHGYQINLNTSVLLAGAPPLDIMSRTPRFLAGDSLYVVPRAGATGEMLVEYGGEEVWVEDAAVRVTVEPGEHCLVARIDGARGRREFPFRGESQWPTERPRICWVDLHAPDHTVEALIARKMSLRVEAVAPLEGLEATVELRAAGRTLSVSMPLGPLPQVIHGEEELWTRLLGDDAAALMHRDARPTLHVYIGSLAAHTFELDRRVRSCWWEQGDEGFVLRSELGDIDFGAVEANAPWTPPATPALGDQEDVLLYAPLELDAAVFGASASFSTLCVAPARLSLTPPRLARPHLVRGRGSVAPGSLGMEALLDAYLRWAVAESASSVAELRRRQITAILEGWSVDVTCGAEWEKEEALLRHVSSDPWQCLTHLLERRRPWHRAASLPLAKDAELARSVVTEIRRALPELWVRVGPPMDLGEADIALLNATYQQAVAATRPEIDPLAPDGDDADSIAVEAFLWAEWFREAKGQAELLPLAELLLPTASANMLVGLDYTLLSQDQALEELARWSAHARPALVGGAVTRPVLEAALLLWLAPERAIHVSWRDAVDTLVVDRSVARAARYIALRSRDFALSERD